ncbi:unnamed protein product [Prunus armeniaca]|uniref:Uncharacterized protein n=1 Tax=Prunus armeniaca TaxID=36596 RepID=A0A6J5WUL3_PRUAR|nr:unnamed protein product [Prunus armeniaca]
MAALDSVKVVEVCKVAPPPSSSACSATPPPEALPLTVFDLLWLRFAPVQRFFFYQISSNSFDTTTLVSKLKASLSIALQQFLPLAGNLALPQGSPKPILTYVHGDAVSLTISSSQKKATAMALQVTIFPKRGFSIGIATHHAILDGKTSTIRVIRDPAGLEAIYSDEFLSMDGRSNNRSLMPSKFRTPAPDSIRGTFVFTRPKIEALRLLAEEIQGGKAFMGFTVDCRSRLDPPISSNYFGNCLVIRLVVAETKALLGEDGLTVAVNATF